MTTMKRRTALKGAILAGLGAPAIARAQGAAIRIGEINSYTAQPAFLAPYRNGWNLALEQANAAIEEIIRSGEGRLLVATALGEGVMAFCSRSPIFFPALRVEIQNLMRAMKATTMTRSTTTKVTSGFQPRWPKTESRTTVKPPTPARAAMIDR